MKKITFLIFTMFISFSAISKTLFFGDSLTGTVGVVYKQKINNDTDVIYTVGSGLENKKVDWIDKMKNTDLNQYDKVIISIGTNDYYISNNENYGNKIRNLIFIIKKSNIKNIIWLLPPPVENTNINKGINNVRDIIIESSNKNGFRVADPRKIIGNNYIEYFNGKQIRTKDGIHYTMKGAELIARKIE